MGRNLNRMGGREGLDSHDCADGSAICVPYLVKPFRAGIIRGNRFRHFVVLLPHAAGTCRQQVEVQCVSARFHRAEEARRFDGVVSRIDQGPRGRVWRVGMRPAVLHDRDRHDVVPWGERSEATGIHAVLAGGKDDGSRDRPPSHGIEDDHAMGGVCAGDRDHAVYVRS